ncbi:hypothetical protein [Brachybacterium sacelli]|uniref:hypothetical protein n=1 Tax=Brachybacterium sacelli TaxID=173364 RepID=UPI003618327A
MFRRSLQVNVNLRGLLTLWTLTGWKGSDTFQKPSRWRRPGSTPRAFAVTHLRRPRRTPVPPGSAQQNRPC